MIKPERTGYSPLTMWMSVPQMVVSVMRITASPTPALGMGNAFNANLIRAAKDQRPHRVC